MWVHVCVNVFVYFHKCVTFELMNVRLYRWAKVWCVHSLVRAT